MPQQHIPQYHVQKDDLDLETDLETCNHASEQKMPLLLVRLPFGVQAAVYMSVPLWSECCVKHVRDDSHTKNSHRHEQPDSSAHIHQ